MSRSPILIALACFVILGLVVPSPGIATDGDLDPGFGAGGKVFTPIGSGAAVAAAVAVQPDGKLVVAGTSSGVGFSQDSDFALVRYHPDGSLDTGFGGGGS